MDAKVPINREKQHEPQELPSLEFWDRHIDAQKE